MMKINISIKLQATSTTSTTTTTTSTSTSTSTTTTSTSTSTTTSADLSWNKTGVRVAGASSAGSGATQFKDPSCLYIDTNGTLYVCDHHNDRVQKWAKGASSGVTVAGSTAGSGATAVPHAQSLTFDKYGNMYVTSHELDKVLRFPPNSFTGTTVAGSSSSGSGLDDLNDPTDMVVDNNLNLYVVDTKNNRVIKWAPNATSGTPVISSTLIDGVQGILFAPGSSNQVYLSDSGQKCIYVWTFGASSPSITLSQVTNSTKTTLNEPQGIIFDSSNNLFVADKKNNRVVMYCVNSTVGIPVVGESGTSPVPTNAMDVAFDSDYNLYVVTEDDEVIKYARL
ncbi:unnamed protein product [Rotaria sordida]|uniref:SMP-30/Gluconolactonase/LRE-like region domain-containing protein n=1 Tax=Rotaria sordida TaxID=392033 RepID=A0A814RIG1_9BILA|nr:unnamed protein product [Rotaria sordida]